MKRLLKLLKIPALLSGVYVLLQAPGAFAQPCGNHALDFDGDGDYITLYPIAGWSPQTDFTVEAWFTALPDAADCDGNFRRLFGFSGGGGTRFEVGQCGGQLVIFWSDDASTMFGPYTLLSPPVDDGLWHCIAAVRRGAGAEVYLDGEPVFGVSGIGALFNTNLFRVGHWGGGSPSVDDPKTQDWLGRVDEVRLWKTALPAAQLAACDFCTLSGTENELVAYWQLDEGVAGADNQTITQVPDASGLGNNGALHPASASPDPGFLLQPGQTSNFVLSNAPLLYPNYRDLDVQITDFNDPTLLLSEICAGTPVHFSLVNCAQQTPSPAGNIAVLWAFRDEPNTFWSSFLPNAPLYGGFSFWSTPEAMTLDCSDNGAGYVVRHFRATIIASDGLGHSCAYTTRETELKICCPVVDVQLQYTVLDPLPFYGNLCAGPVRVQVSLLSTHPYIAGAGIQWWVNGVYDPGLDHQTAFEYNGAASAPELCFEAVVQNGICPPAKAKICIPVDPVPQCGLIDGLPAPPGLEPPPPAPGQSYLICPGADASVGMVDPSAFKDCNPVWQFRFPPPNDNWVDLGASNATQNANALPQLYPPNNPLSPYLWPSGASCIFYRIKCIPKSGDISGCAPCYSNEVKICLKTPPPDPVITSSANPICKGDSATLSVTPVPGAVLYTWYCNAAEIASGPSLTSVKVPYDGDYQVIVSDGCFTLESQLYHVNVCELVPIINCPDGDNPCACLGEPITISACNSFYNCGHLSDLQFTWTASNGGPGAASGVNGCAFTHIPVSGGTLYTVTVTDTAAPYCSASKSIFIVPCE